MVQLTNIEDNAAASDLLSRPDHGRRVSAARRLIRRARLLPIREKIYGLVGFVLVGFFGWSLDKGFDFFANRGLERRAEAAQRALSARTAAIDSGVRDLQAKLNALTSGETSAEDAAQIAIDAQSLLGELRLLSRVLSVAGQIGDNLASSTVAMKQAEIARTGASYVPDFVLAIGSGAELCREGAMFGVAADRPEDNVVAVNLSYQGQEGNGGSGQPGFGGGTAMSPGNEIFIETETGIISVGFQGLEGEPGSGAYRFSVQCPDA